MRIPSSSPALARPLAVAAAILLAVSAAGCSSNSNRGDRPENPFKTAAEGPGGPKSPLSDRELRQQAQELYRHAREALTNSDYSVAITRYDGLIARYPFSDYSTQAELEKIFAQYKSFQFDEAITAADRFLRAHPRHPHADYIMYLKGITDFERDQGLMEAMMPNSSKRDIGSQRRAFEDFALLLQRYPTSRYASDARQRMLFARNRIADHELSVAQFYVTRGAYVAAAKRATDIITEYPGAPATADALKILQRSYAKAGLEQEAKDSATVIAMNSDTVQYSDAPKPGVIAADPNALPPAQETASAKPGLMSRFAGMFGLFDTTKPENQHTYVIGGDKPAAPDAGSAGNGTTGTGTAADGSAAGQAPAKSGGFSLSSGYQDATATTAAPKPDAATAQQQQPAAAQQQDKPGFFTWFAGLFSFLDPGKRDEPPVAVPPPAPQTPASKSSPDSAK
ncbi:MAG: outer membrane protein assembly factor BamD [Nevskia sp.]|nr:outer membrane protein assembly factor BamD [Nevskia sp.]